MLRILLFLAALVVLAFLAFGIVALGGAVVAAVFGVRRVRQRLAARKFQRMRQATPANPLDQAWSDVAGEADWAASRIAAARTSCSRLLAIADADPLATDAVDWANVVRRRVPDLVAACMAESADATPSERRRNLEDLIESLEKIGAEADRRRDRHRGTQVTPFQVQRTYVDQRTRPDPLN
ncbi:hypothetical protein [Sphingomonas turrisvirgatae]|uniref:Uncharacterized protein n=1 Tax=Sphingomonas turrisvirgatae TaxID=1888892 RepID=A0A1E3LQL4_9SPHN|nr:hypothetical protein [Sphingomonas turrisvirgatae]ODP35994.1 hypothetical protein BFL28_07870 [Sphingomonas turrisvirgatae]